MVSKEDWLPVLGKEFELIEFLFKNFHRGKSTGT